MALKDDLISRTLQKIRNKLNDDQGWFRGGKFTPGQQVQRIGSDVGYQARNLYQQTRQNAWSPGGTNYEATKFIQGGINKIANLPRIELKKPQVNIRSKPLQTVAQTGINLAYGVPESIINTPRNYLTGIARVGQELGTSKKEGRKINTQTIVGGVAPLAESIFDVATMGGSKVAKNIAKEGIEQVAKGGLRYAIKSGATKGALAGGFGGLTYGLDTQYGKDFNTGEVLKSTLGGLAIGGVLGGASGAAGYGYGKLTDDVATNVKKLKPNISDKKAKDIAKRYIQDEAGLMRGSRPKNYGQKVKFYGDLRESLGMDRYGQDIPQLGNSIRKLTPEESADMAARKLQTPEVKPGLKERGVMKTIRTSPETKVPLKQSIEQITGPSRYYKPYSDKTSIRDAQVLLDTQGMDAVKKQVLTGDYSKTNVAAGEMLVSKAMNEGRIDDAKEILENLSLKATQSGQANQAWSMWSRMTPEGMLKYALNTTRTAEENMGAATKFIRQVIGKNNKIEITSKEAQAITDLMVKANKATGNQKKLYTRQALELINNKIPYGVSQFIDEFRYNNMLSNPKSHARNIYSNALNTFFSTPASMVAQGKPGKAVKYYSGLIKGANQASQDALNAFKGITDIEKPDIKQLGSKLPKGLTWPTRALEAEDKLFTGLIKSGLKASGADNAEAERLAKYFLLRTDVGEGGQGMVSQGIDKVSGWLSRSPKAVRWFVPFVKTPMNAVKQWVDLSPVGVLNLPGNQYKREQIGKVLLGTAMTGIGASFALQDKTTWSAPTDPTAKQLFYASGRKAFSVQVGDKWVPMWYFGPFAFAMAIPAAMKHYQEESRTALTDSGIEKATQAVGDLMNFVVGQTPLTGLNTFARLAQGDIDYSIASNLGFTASQLVPFTGLMRYISNIVDPIYRKTSGFVEQIEAGIPGLSKNLKPYTEPMGEPSKRLPINNVLPYDVGQINQDSTYQNALYERQTRLQQNAVMSKAKKDFEKGITQEGGDYIMYLNENNNVSTLDLTKLDEIANMPENSRYQLAEKESKQYSKAATIMDNEFLTDDQKLSAIQRLGVTPEDAAYYAKANDSTNLKTMFALDELARATTYGEVVQILAPLRKQVNGQMIVTNTVLDNLVDEGYLTKAQAKELKKYKFEDGNLVPIKKYSGGGSKSLKKVTVSKPSVRKVQLKKMSVPKLATTKVKEFKPITYSKEPGLKIGKLQLNK